MFRKKHLEIDLLKIRIKTLEAQIKGLQAEIRQLKIQKSGRTFSSKGEDMSNIDNYGDPIFQSQSGQGWILSGGSSISISGKPYEPTSGEPGYVSHPIKYYFPYESLGDKNE